MEIPTRTGIEIHELKNPEFAPFYGIILPIVAFFGIIGNLTCCWVFTRKHMRSSATTYLTALALADSLFLITSCIFYSPRPLMWVVNDEDPEFEYPYPEMYSRSEPLVNVAHVLIIMYTLSAAVDHYAFIFKAKKYMRWTQVEPAQKISIIILGCVLLLHIMNFFKLVVVESELPNRKVYKVCISAFYMKELPQAWDKYIYFIVFGWLPMLVLLAVELLLCYLWWTWNRKNLIDQPDRFFKDGRSNKTVIIIGFVAFFSLLPDLIMQSATLGEVTTNDGLPVCVHRAINIARAMSFDTRWELLVNIFAVFNASYKIIIYMIANNQFRWTVLYCLIKPFKKPETQPSTKSRFGPTFSRRKNNESRNGGGRNVINTNRGQNTPQSQSSNPYYNRTENNQGQRPYVITGSDVIMAAPPVGSHTDDLKYHEDRFGSRQLVVAGSSAGQSKENLRAGNGDTSLPHNMSTPPQYQSHYPNSADIHPKSFVNSPRDVHSTDQQRREQGQWANGPRNQSGPYNGDQPIASTSAEPAKLKWRQDKLEPFARPAPTNNGAHQLTVTGGPWNYDVMEMTV